MKLSYTETEAGQPPDKWNQSNDMINPYRTVFQYLVGGAYILNNAL